jgi:hypothetical protein
VAFFALLSFVLVVDVVSPAVLSFVVWQPCSPTEQIFNPIPHFLYSRARASSPQRGADIAREYQIKEYSANISARRAKYCARYTFREKKLPADTRARMS